MFYLQAGMKHEKLTLALEPETASIFCMKVPLWKCKLDNQIYSFRPFDVGTKYLLLDIGGSIFFCFF